MARAFGLNPRVVLDEMPWSEVLVWCAWATENAEWAEMERVTPGYVAQECERLKQRMLQAGTRRRRKQSAIIK